MCSASLSEYWNVTSTVNTTTNDTIKQYDLLKQPVHMIVIYAIAYSIVFLSALFGNILVVTVVYRNATMHTVTNYFIVNLAVADILVALFCLPITLLSNLYTGKSHFLKEKGRDLTQSCDKILQKHVCENRNIQDILPEQNNLHFCTLLFHCI